MKQTLRIILFSALATAALIKGVPALAEPADVNVAVVETGDLNLADAAGQSRLEQRLIVAAHAVCDTASPVDLKAGNAEAKCRSDVLSAARDRAQAMVASGTRNRAVVLAASR